MIVNKYAADLYPVLIVNLITCADIGIQLKVELLGHVLVYHHHQLDGYC